jgi:hypothetical protein
MKARDIDVGDLARVNGKTVQVTGLGEGWKLGRARIEISYKGGTRSGMLRPGPDDDVRVVYGQRGGRRPRR